MGGTFSLEGRVEICQNNEYSTVCDDFWDELEAKVVCGQLEYTGESELSPCNYAMSEMHIEELGLRTRLGIHMS